MTADSSSSIGFYDPLPNPAVVSIQADRVQLWLRRGARPSDSARQLLVKEGILAARPFKITPRPEPAEPAKAEKPAAATAVAEKPETPAATADEPTAAADEPATEESSVETIEASAPSATEPAVNEAAAESVDAKASASAPDEAGGVAGGSADAPKARPGGVPAPTGPPAAGANTEDATE